MTIYRVTIGIQGRTKEEFRRHKPKREEMYAYIRQQLAAGYSLAEIVFCWGPVTLR